MTTKAKQDTARALIDLLVASDRAALVTMGDGDRWVTDSFVAVRLTGPCVPVPAWALVEGAEDGTYRLTVSKGLVPLTGGPWAGGTVSSGVLAPYFEDAQAGDPVHPSPWTFGDSALWERASDDGWQPVALNAAVAKAWQAIADNSNGVRLEWRQVGEGKPVRVLARRRDVGTYLDPRRRQAAEETAASASPTIVGLIMPRRADWPSLPKSLS